MRKKQHKNIFHATGKINPQKQQRNISSLCCALRFLFYVWIYLFIFGERQGENECWERVK